MKVHTPRIRVDLPVLMHGTAAKKNRTDRRNVGCSDQAIGHMNPNSHVDQAGSGDLVSILIHLFR